TALQNLVIQGRYKDYKPKDGRETYQDILDRVGLADAGNKKVREFSMGMKQRLGLALCLVGEPEFIILDEPYVSLDPVGVNDFRKILLQLNKEGVTILFSCHTLAEMTKVATRYGFIHKGKLRKEITAEQLELELKEKNEDLEAYFLRHLEEWNNG
ncbi:MAG: ATP-binding cassette domain-containing protein, partial [Lachnospiraceae bacterium]|nr:ATP-binding cassette domain-containing protein [Lachnospiraceae bacterium]